MGGGGRARGPRARSGSAMVKTEPWPLPALSAEATKDAINRARTVVEIAGQHLGKLRSIDVGPFQVTAPGSTQTGDYGSYDTSTRQKDVTSVVNVTFAVK